ncbi:MAG: ATP-grasp fold amidoligase family protein, partial [Kiloniellales bacterium]|nr:ATP-grasp fold amidoligase family protein [Kiloniellales bacterium]
YPAGGLDPRPERLGEMFQLAERLAAPFSFMRVDFLVADGRLKIGELTSLPENAVGVFAPKVYDQRLGRLFADPKLEIEAVLEA